MYISRESIHRSSNYNCYEKFELDFGKIFISNIFAASKTRPQKIDLN